MQIYKEKNIKRKSKVSCFNYKYQKCVDLISLIVDKNNLENDMTYKFTSLAELLNKVGRYIRKNKLNKYEY